MPVKEKAIYLTFDDGPHITATPFVLEQLKKYDAKATFFCIGKNVIDHPDIYARIIAEGHKVGNHTHNHLNGWKTENEKYFENVCEASNHIYTNILRPPYGKIKRSQAKILQQNLNYKIIMWDVLSADFDCTITAQKCLDNVLRNAKDGSIIVFHDSAKAFDRMSFALPKVLERFTRQGYCFKKID
jgi:peptidoglycan/xylan/chitin deacetylase (PgdA/CDA1 family)